MSYETVTKREQKIKMIEKHFNMLIGCKIEGYEVPQLFLLGDEEWINWMDLPLYLTINGLTLSIVWSEFDALSISIGRTLPFAVGGCTIRWICEGDKLLDSIIGKKITSVSLGQGQMSIKENELEIWTRLLILLDDGTTFEIFNALDENGFCLHKGDIEGKIVNCINKNEKLL